MNQLPVEQLHLIMDHLKPMHLLRLMCTCRTMYEIGRKHPRWTKTRLDRGLPSANPAARKLKLDFDIVQNFMKHACCLCRRRAGGINGVCKDCRKHNQCWNTLNSAKESKQRTQEFIDMLSSGLEKEHAAMVEVTSRVKRAEEVMMGQRRRVVRHIQ